ncbi:hypothetical protein [Zhongshania aliphaticivorans]|uniref:hypothetical protein n=1 Tax=Zhongshania aliphaticivorans TaxID=1470434 RepID=UPI0013310043|nr:hypothetical protein [Zhongshania aliphaticivorans]
MVKLDPSIAQFIKPRKTWQYSDEFKVKAIPLSLIDEIQVKEAAGTIENGCIHE